MTPVQIELARHALGLDGRQKVSYRNRFVASERHRDFDDWMEMVGAGEAERHKSKLFGGADLFILTEEGARKALRGREKLDPEDFPAALQHEAPQP